MTKADMQKLIKKQAEEIQKLKDCSIAELHIQRPIENLFTKDALLWKDGKKAFITFDFLDGTRLEIKCNPLDVTRVME